MFFLKKKKEDNAKLPISRVNQYYYKEKIYYSHKGFLGHIYKSDVINQENIETLFSYFYNCLINGVSAGTKAGSKEAALWLQVFQSHYGFDNIVINKASQSYMDKIYERDH